MPSLIYIARITSLSEELATALRSAGCQVRSFKPGDITEDECLLAMTSEAVATAFCPDGQKVGAETSGAATLATPDMSEQLGSQAAVWNSIKKAVTAESQENRQPAAPVASLEEPKALEVSLARVERQAVSRPQDRATGQIPPSPMIPASSPDVSYPPRKVRATKEQVYRVLRSPLSTVVALLLFSVVYRGFVHPRTEVNIGHAANYHARSDPNSANLPTVLASPGESAPQSTPLGPASVGPLKPMDDRVQGHLSRSGSGAGDFTNRVALRAQGQTTQQNPDLRHPRSSSIQKRIVVD